MKQGKINDRVLLKLVDQGKSQVEAAEHFGVSKQAVNKRLRELRGRQTKVIVSKKIEQAVDANFDAMQQLYDINRRTLELLDEAEKNPELSLKCIAETRNQIRLASDLYQQMYSVQVVNEFMQTVVGILKDVDLNVYQEFKRRINSHGSLRAALRIS